MPYHYLLDRPVRLMQTLDDRIEFIRRYSAALYAVKRRGHRFLFILN
ncbi:MAG: hypothetical protein GXO27_00740 [Chlorobi bacterium]|nr:hypothetical protein [Chlorobiota bacterium]